MKETLQERFGEELEVMLFRSAARGDQGDFSDIDVLVLIPGKLTNRVEIEVFDLSDELEPKYSVILGIIVSENNRLLEIK